MPRPLWLTLSIAPLMAGCLNSPTPQTAPDAVESLVAVVEQRLDIANDVAVSKWYSGKPVQDSERERQVILNAESQAQAFNLKRDDVHSFMTAQMEANKVVQYARIAQWHESGQAPQPPATSLTQGIRTRLDTLQPDLMHKYAAFLPYRSKSDCQSWLQSTTRRKAADAVMLSALQRATDGLCKTEQKSD